MSEILKLLNRLTDVWVVGKCKCFMQRSKSTTHIDCFILEQWVLEELNECARLISFGYEFRTGTPAMEDSIIYAESLDSLRTEARDDFAYRKSSS
ncbi:unnamed protein product [Angiostrongylus costaricensis]|uniref:IRS-type PTB domain-containing protein n=1 Tax=Angiostrongylus costaricensis TaxID=334426 RepID=A0A0R3PPY0_ANGCS|nr:unnamed protein product [Angiostrongylus costaricensis]